MKTWYEMLVKNIRSYASLELKPIGEVEKELGLSKGYISRINSGEIDPRFSLILRISEKLSISINDLIHRDCFRDELLKRRKEELISQIEALEQELSSVESTEEV